jgi:hypothetical protein
MEPVFAAVVLVLCVGALLRLVIGPTRRQRLDAALRRAWFQTRVRAVTLWRWRRMRREADQAARDAIARASGRASRASGEWKGKVFEPDAFKKPRKPH